MHVLITGDTCIDNRGCMYCNSNRALTRAPFGREVAEDGLIATFSDHDDSVYSVAWGDAWVFASLSYDGRMVVNQASIRIS